MARLLWLPFDMNSTTALVEFNATQNLTIQSTVARSAYAGRVNSLSSGAAKHCRVNLATSASNGPFFKRMYFRWDTFPSIEVRFWVFSGSTTIGSSVIYYLTIDSSGVIRLYDEDGQIGSAASSVVTGRFYRIETQYDRTGSAGAHVVNARINGVQFAGASDRSLSAGGFIWFCGMNLNNEANTAGDAYMDDGAVNNNSGSFQNSWCGEGTIAVMLPDSDGDNHGLTTQTGGTAGAANNFTRVQEMPPNDATSFNGDNTVSNTDDYNLAASPAALGSTDTINAVAVGVRAAGSAASANASYVVRCKASSGGTVEESSASTPASTGWATHGTTTTLTPKLTMYDLPGASTTAWTKADLDTTQVGVRISTGNTNRADISAMWLLVDYSPAAAAAQSKSGFMQIFN